ncbi:uncharacterized protein CANTADRAFT_19202 [Suhomyces tanzawaensis NRRL Y-17324]|uniref:Securin n=1 Tax=Suhomyces tanzawaensis NRRL Y-17324 TaxID=984487 RepID=A0A1E4SPY0_9ASCO|nr:uncharacterized protein CANTADRAFT_19202 [Suhomyces tanzawaensis NRRL Y-17324]ODV81573.1 hypothetical protein CANTADRAFT_19202 [Suhomyces tanzawaensis NRRL Y-17324]
MTGRPLIFSDKENAAKAVPKAGFLNSENQFPQRKAPLGAKPTQGRRVPMARVPLGGKDLNMLAPGLSRSQSTLNTKNVRPKVFLPKPPVLSKANSSLGFTHTSTNFTKPAVAVAHEAPVDTRPTLKFTNDTQLGPEKANRLVNLIPDTPTDDLVKQASEHLLPDSQALSSTLTAKTKTLHASNIYIHDINYNNVDPVKKLKRSSSSSMDSGTNKAQKFSTDRLEKFNQELIENDYSLEYVPKEESPIPYVPLGMESLDNDDLNFFSKPHLTKSSHSTFEQLDNGVMLKDLDTSLSFGYEEEVSNDGLNYPKVPETTGEDEQLGLSVDELHDLLD